MRAGRAAEAFPGWSDGRPASQCSARFLRTGGIRILAGARRFMSARPGINKASAKHCKLTRLISSKAAERRAICLSAVRICANTQPGRRRVKHSQCH
jgi:hypothetical protein